MRNTGDLDVVEVERLDLVLAGSWLSLVLLLRLSLLHCLLGYRRRPHLVDDIARAGLVAIGGARSVGNVVHHDVVVVLMITVGVAGFQELVAFGVKKTHGL